MLRKTTALLLLAVLLGLSLCACAGGGPTLVGKWTIWVEQTDELLSTLRESTQLDTLISDQKIFLPFTLEFQTNGTVDFSIDNEKYYPELLKLIPSIVESIYQKYEAQGMSRQEIDEMALQYTGMTVEETMKSTIIYALSQYQGAIAILYYKTEGSRLYLSRQKGVFSDNYAMFYCLGNTLAIDHTDGVPGLDSLARSGAAVPLLFGK